MAEGGEDNNNSELDFSKYQEKEKSSISGANITEFENVGGLSVIERDQHDVQRTLANDISLDGRRNPHSTYFQNSPEDTLSDVFPTSETESRIKWEDNGNLPSLEEAAEAIRTMPLGGDLMSAFMGMTVSKLKNAGPGQLIYSSHQSLSWFNSPLWSESTRTVVLKNKTNKENVTVSIKIDCNEHCFKLAASSERHSSEMEVTLDPLSTLSIPISFHPVRKGQICSRLVVTYRSRRFYIFLYGYGGASSVFCRDVDFSFNYNQPAVFVSETTPTASFVLYNSGDEDAIFAVSKTSSDCTVSPVNGYLPPNGSLKVFIRCKGALLNAKPSRKPWPIVEKVSVTVEDKTTFLRIDKMKYFKDELRSYEPQYEIISDLVDDPATSAPPEKKTINICVCIKPL